MTDEAPPWLKAAAEGADGAEKKPKVGGRKRTAGTRVGKGRIEYGSEGIGWGGPAKGAGVPTEGKLTLGPPTAEERERKSAKVRDEQERLQVVKDVIFDMATDPDIDPTTKLNAAYKLATMIEGMPIARVVTAKVEEPEDLKDVSPEKASQAYQRFITRQ